MLKRFVELDLNNCDRVEQCITKNYKYANKVSPAQSLTDMPRCLECEDTEMSTVPSDCCLPVQTIDNPDYCHIIPQYHSQD